MYDAGDDALILSHPTTFEQLEVSGETFGAQRRFLADGAFVDVLSHDGEVVGVQLPDEIRATVVETDPRFKGESKDGGRLKPCTLDTGATTRVPTYVEAGDVVVVKGPRTGALGEFVRRVRET
jgi:elongation factor P